MQKTNSPPTREPLKKRWSIAAKISPEADQNLENYHPVLRQILFNRGYATTESAEEFLRGGDTAPADQMLGIDAAVDRLIHAINTQEQVVVFGDYDTDGVTGTALMVQALRAAGAQVQAYIPNRFTEGYGLNNNALEMLKEGGAALVVTVDCGIRAFNEAEHASQIGLDLIISDHHTTGSELPPAVAVINPKQPGDPYPHKNLAGVGTAYKLACALLEKLSSNAVDPHALTDLVALGTVADLVPLVGENRQLVRQGLAQIWRKQRQGLLSLISVARLKPEKVRARDIGFILGPRLNAAGRLGSAMQAYDLLTAEDVFEAGRLAQALDNTNRERQEVTGTMVETSEELALKEGRDQPLLYAAHPDFNLGVVGLAASRLVERFYRPSIIAHQGEQVTRASCRSIPEFHITDALDECADLLEHHGGHAAAAGFTVRNENAGALVEQLNAIAERQLGDKDLQPVLNAEAEVPLKDLGAHLLEQLDWLEPTGYGNPEALFVSRDLKVSQSRAVGQESSHLKLSVTDGWVTYDAIAFRQGHWHEKLPPRIDLLYSFELNEFNGRRTLQLNVKDLHPSRA
ncbi:MAG: single-stranded-DNA-specific exonuclease RecJ [Anaerolineae bacterium]|nr:single-stranded-DNA-specific exonuclease RecJ [Anaerolineae bacterium]